MCSSDGMGRPKLFGPKLIVKVKKLAEKAVEELTAGIWLCSFCAKAEKSFFMLDLHIETVCEELSQMEYDIALQYLGITKILLFTLWNTKWERQEDVLFICVNVLAMWVNI